MMKPASWVNGRTRDSYDYIQQPNLNQTSYTKRRLNKILNYLSENIRKQVEGKIVLKLHAQRLNSGPQI